jgi:tripartite-type tricarboxylate transporter receptor subunit TctC
MLLAKALYQEGKLPEAAKAYKDSLTAYRNCNALGGDGYDLAVRGLVEVLMAQGNPAEAAKASALAVFLPSSARVRAASGDATMRKVMVVAAPLALAAGVIATLLQHGALTQSYPAKPVKLIVTYPPGGSSDLIARLVGQKLSELWSQPVIVESKPGAAGSIGMDYAAKQAPDGYSFVVGNIGPAAVNPLLTKLPYDVERDFVAISLIATGPNILVVHPDVPAKSLAELADLAKSSATKLNYGTSGPGSISHLAGEMFKTLTGSKAVEVPYKGGILGVQDLVAGHIQYIFSDSLPAMQFIRAGRARALCVTGAERSPIMPELPPCAESVPGLVAVNWWGVFMPAGTPKAITEKFHADMVKVMQDAGVKKKFAAAVDYSGTVSHFLRERLEQGPVMRGQQRQHFRERRRLAELQMLRHVPLVLFAFAARGLDGFGLRIDARDDVEKVLRLALHHELLLMIKLRKQFAILLEFFTQGFNQVGEQLIHGVLKAGCGAHASGARFWAAR